MSRTVKVDPPKIYRKEAKPARKQTGRAFRVANRRAARALRADRVDPDAVVLPVDVGTCGWLTW